MKALKHIFSEPLIVATSLAALIHSTWVLGTLMSGLQPEAGINIEFIGWIIPPFLISISLDIGQVVTSWKIRERGFNTSLGITFGVFSFATYYLQFQYMIHHVPMMTLSQGIRSEWLPVVQLLSDLSIVIIPSLMPLSTLLYTFSGHNHKKQDVTHEIDVIKETVTVPMLPTKQPEIEDLPLLLPVVWESTQEQPKELEDLPLTPVRSGFEGMSKEEVEWFINPLASLTTEFLGDAKKSGTTGRKSKKPTDPENG